MLGKTHRRIAKEIAKELNLGEREAGLLETGSVNPDSWINFPHHYGKEDEIVRNILDARRLFLQGDDECYFRLGVALHYIQDRWTLRPRTGDKHTKWERKIERVPILNDSDFMKMIKRAPLPTKAEQVYLGFLEEISKGVTGMTTADIFKNISSASSIPSGKYFLVGDEKFPIYSAPYIPNVKNLSGLGKKAIPYALQGHPTTWSNPVLDINFSYRICLEIARKVFSREHDKDDWYNAKGMVKR